MKPKGPVEPRSRGAPTWARWLVGRAARQGRADEAVGDLEEAHLRRLTRMSGLRARFITGLEAVDMAAALFRDRRRRRFIGEVGLQPGEGRFAGLPTVSLLDFKLGGRMLARYPGLTVVGGLAMALGITFGATGFHLVSELLFPNHPYAEVERIVGIQNVDVRTSRRQSRALRDFTVWKDELRSIEYIGAQRTGVRAGLDPGNGEPVPVAGVAISASAFALAPVPPYLGRPLLTADEAPGAPAVVVLAFETWERWFAADEGVVGRVVRLGGEPTTVVGVMPPHFALHVPSGDLIYPGAQDHWIPFRQDPLGVAPGEGPRIDVFGQLVSGVSLNEARAELSALGARMASDSPETHRSVRPGLVNFANPFGEGGGIPVTGVLTMAGVFIVMVMGVLCANVALLLYARAATREAELIVRSALGASRSRVVTQLFVEALVLASVAVIVGLVGASTAVGWAVTMLEAVGASEDIQQPWVRDSLSWSTMFFAAVLGVAGAVVAGVLPGLRATGRRAGVALQPGPSRGVGNPFGMVSQGFILLQVALTAVLIPILVMVGNQTWDLRRARMSFPADEYLAVRLEMDAADAGQDEESGQGFMALFEERYRDLARRVALESSVQGVTFAEELPGGGHMERAVELARAVGGDTALRVMETQVASVDPDFFEVMGTALSAGRGFGAGDLGGDSPSVIVNESFARMVLGGDNALGRRFRYASLDPLDSSQENAWLEVVGVVQDISLSTDPTQENNAGVYHPRSGRESYPVRMAVHLSGPPLAFAGRLRELALQVSPALRVHQTMSLDQAGQGVRAVYTFFFRALFLGGGLALLLTIAGVYAVLALTVSRRTREIGLRVALGAERNRVVRAILAQLAPWIAVGALVGSIVGVRLAYAFAEVPWERSPSSWGQVTIYLIAMLAACLLACTVPIRRALAIEPAEALAADM